MARLVKKNTVHSIKGVDNSRWFFFAILFLIIDYGRPQDVIPIGFVRPAMLVNLVLIYYIVTTKGVFKLTSSNQTRMIWYFIALTAVYIPFAVNNYYAYKTTTTMLLYMPVIISIVACVNSVARLKILIIVMSSLGVYVTLYGLTHSGTGSGNYFADENDLSLFINMLLPFYYFMFLYEKGIFLKVFYGVGVIVGLMGIVVSFSRGGFVGLLAVGFVIWMVSPRKILSIVLLILLGTGFLLYSGDEYLADMKTITDTKESTANARILSWKAGWDMFVDNPFGVGGNNFQIRFPEYQSPEFSRGMWGRVAHSLWFTLLPELGIIGVLLYFRLLFMNFKDILFVKGVDFDVNRDMQFLHAISISLLASFAGYFASGTFLSVLYYPHYWYFTAVVIVMTKITKNLINSQN